MNLKKVYRLYREEGLMVRRRRGRKRALGTRAPLQSARRPNQVWVLDFVADVLESGRRLRVFNVEDQFTRTGLATEVDTSLPSARIVRVLDRLLAEHDKPLLIVSDNGTELTSNAMLKWTAINGIEWHYIASGKPQQNGFMESFNGNCATNASTNRCSHRWLKQGASLNVGASITTQRAHFRASITKHRKSSLRTGTLRSITRRCHMQRLRRQRAGPLRYVGPPRPGPLLNRPARGKMRTDSAYDWREIGEQVRSGSLNRNCRLNVALIYIPLMGTFISELSKGGREQD